MNPSLVSIVRWLLPMLLPIALGALMVRTRRLPVGGRALDGLNIYALYVAFPSLIAHGLLTSDMALPTSWAFWSLWPVSLGVCLVAMLVWRRIRAPEEGAASMALSVCFGNVAYLGLPYVAFFVASSLKAQTLLVTTIHVVLAVTIGPVVYARWAGIGGQSVGVVVRRVLALPLFWAPWVGLAGRALAPEFAAEGATLVRPFAQSAIPVVLFMLGAYLYEHRAALRRWDRELVAILAVRLIAAPAVVLMLGSLANFFGLLSAQSLGIHVMMAGMPVAITTFSLAKDFKTRPEQMASVIVWSTVISMGTLPCWWWVTQWWIP